MPQQQHIWDVALEVDGGGRFVYDEVDLSTMRQSSKTTTIFLKQVWRLTRGARLWGPQRSTYTAQKRQSARNKLERDFAELLRSKVGRRSFREITNPKARPASPTEWRLSLNNGSEHMLFGRANYLQIDAPSKTAGHGDTLDDGNIDEAFAHQGDDVETAMRPAQATRWNPQLWVGSTAGDERSFYWYGKILAGRAQIEAATPSRIAYFEWSIPDDADIDDEDVWWEFMPALGHTIAPEFIRGELERARRRVDEGGEDLWRRSYGNQWPKVPIMTAEGRPPKIPAEWWKATGLVAFYPCEPGTVTIGWDVTKDGEWSSITIGAGSLKAPYVETIEHRQAVGWLPDRLVELVAKWKPLAVGCNPAGPAGAQVSPILRAFSEAKLDANLLHQLSEREYKQACGGFYTDVVEGRLKRPADGQGPLDLAAGDATERTLGDAWAWDLRNVTVPISPLTSATIARALLPVEKPKEPPRKPRFVSW